MASSGPTNVEFALLGWPEDKPTLRLDFRAFSYAGKFVMSSTGKAVVRRVGENGTREPVVEVDDDLPSFDPSEFESGLLAAASFNEDRTDPGVLWVRYLTVHREYRGQGLGARLAAFVAERAEERGYRRLRIAVNNPFSYEALYKAGFTYTNRETGLAEVVLERPGERDRVTYQCGLDVFRDRDLDDPEQGFLARKERQEPPRLVEPPAEWVDAVEGNERG